jgi:hypothetical protein
MLVSSEYILITPRKIRMHLARQKSVFGNVGLSGVVVEGQDEQPCYADYDAKKGEVWWEFEDFGIALEKSAGS